MEETHISAREVLRGRKYIEDQVAGTISIIIPTQVGSHFLNFINSEILQIYIRARRLRRPFHSNGARYGRVHDTAPIFSHDTSKRRERYTTPEMWIVHPVSTKLLLGAPNSLLIMKYLAVFETTNIFSCPSY